MMKKIYKDDEDGNNGTSVYVGCETLNKIQWTWWFWGGHDYENEYDDFDHENYVDSDNKDVKIFAFPILLWQLGISHPCLYRLDNLHWEDLRSIEDMYMSIYFFNFSPLCVFIVI